MKFSQTVIAAVPERTYQATILQLTAPQSITVQRPIDAIPGRGGIDVRMQAKLGGDLPGVREYFQFYPYSCLEQRASTAIGLGNPAQWNALMGGITDYMDRDGLLKFWPFLRDGDDALTAYILSVGDEAGWEIPESAKSRIEQALVGFVEGRVVRYWRDADRRPVDPEDRRAGSTVAQQERVQREMARQHLASSPTCGRPPR